MEKSVEQTAPRHWWPPAGDWREMSTLLPNYYVDVTYAREWFAGTRPFPPTDKEFSSIEEFAKYVKGCQFFLGSGLHDREKAEELLERHIRLLGKELRNEREPKPLSAAVTTELIERGWTPPSTPES